MKLDIVVLFILICLIMLTIFFFIMRKFMRKNIEKNESFTSLTPLGQSDVINSFLRDYGFLNTNELNEFVTNQKYTENVSKIPGSDVLKLYYSSFSNTPKDKTCWKALVGKDHVNFEAVPYSNNENGIEMLANKCTGPQTMSMGIKGNGSFSIFMYMMVKALPKKKETVLQLFGNTISNNALSLHLDPSGKFSVQFGAPGDNPELQSSNKCKMNQPFLFVINKHAEKLEIWEDGTYYQMDQPVPAVLLSNKPMIINPSKHLNFNLFSFGACSMAFSEEMLLDKYFKNEMSKTSPEFFSNSQRVLEFEKELNKTKDCPFDDSVCASCPEIKEWGNMNMFMNKAGDDCLKSVDNFCSKNIDHPHCECWRPNASRTCQLLLSSIKKEPLVNPGKLTDVEMKEIKQKYELCDCSEKENLQNEILLLEKNKNSELRHLNASMGDSQSHMRVVPEDYRPPPSFNENKSLTSGFWSWLFG